jgi:hypothetical protein
MDEPGRKENVKMFYRLVKDGNDVELHQEMVFRFSPEQTEHLIHFLQEATIYHDHTSYAVGGDSIYDLSFGPREIDYDQPIEAEKHFLTIEYIPMSKSRDGFPQAIYITKERTLKLLELLKAISQERS